MHLLYRHAECPLQAALALSVCFAPNNILTPITYMASSIEHTIVSQRRNGEVLNLAVQHYDQTNQVHLAVFDGDPDSPEVKQEVELSFEEVLRLLKPLLSRPEIVAILQQ